MIHTALQVLGLVIACCGAWLAFGVGGVLLVGGLALAIGSVFVELGAQQNAKDGG
jgi:hypothetical protein